MKGYLIFAIVALVVTSLVSSCRSLEPISAEPKIYLSPEAPIEVRLNQEFIIATGSEPQTGYMWREEYDKKMLELVSSTFEVNKAIKLEEGKISLEQHFQFKARKRGKTEVAINLASPSLFVVRQKIFKVNIK